MFRKVTENGATYLFVAPVDRGNEKGEGDDERMDVHSGLRLLDESQIRVASSRKRSERATAGHIDRGQGDASVFTQSHGYVKMIIVIDRL